MREEEESCLWSPGACEPLSEITFTPSGADPNYQLFGAYRGTMRSLDGTAYPVAGAHGVCESFRARLLRSLVSRRGPG
jgi:hypothetical protein